MAATGAMGATKREGKGGNGVVKENSGGTVVEVEVGGDIEGVGTQQAAAAAASLVARREQRLKVLGMKQLAC